MNIRGEYGSLQNYICKNNSRRIRLYPVDGYVVIDNPMDKLRLYVGKMQPIKDEKTFRDLLINDDLSIRFNGYEGKDWLFYSETIATFGGDGIIPQIVYDIPIDLFVWESEYNRHIGRRKSHEEHKNSYGQYAGSYAQDVEMLSDDFINDVLDGDPEAYWNID